MATSHTHTTFKQAQPSEAKATTKAAVGKPKPTAPVGKPKGKKQSLADKVEAARKTLEAARLKKQEQELLAELERLAEFDEAEEE